MTRYIEHVTLTTGHQRRSWRHEISPEAMHVVSALLDAVLAEGETAIPATGCTLTATADGRCMIATVWHERAPLVTFGVAAKSRCGVRLWTLLRHHAVVPLAEVERPGEPWCAVRLEPGLALYPETAHWLGDFERRLAWAWLERLRVRE